MAKRKKKATKKRAKRSPKAKGRKRITTTTTSKVVRDEVLMNSRVIAEEGPYRVEFYAPGEHDLYGESGVDAYAAILWKGDEPQAAVASEEPRSTYRQGIFLLDEVMGRRELLGRRRPLATGRFRARNQGRRYEISEWVEFEMEGRAEGEAQELDVDYQDILDAVELTPELEDAQTRFTDEANRVVEGWVDTHPAQASDLIESDDYESADDIAWNTWAAIVGHGVGFWENMESQDWDSLEKAIASDKALAEAAQNLENEIDYAVGLAAGAEMVENPRRRRRRRRVHTPGTGLRVRRGII